LLLNNRCMSPTFDVTARTAKRPLRLALCFLLLLFGQATAQAASAAAGKNRIPAEAAKPPILCFVVDPDLQGSYAGGCINGKASGKGRAVGRDTYEGEFSEGAPNGKGTYTWGPGTKWSGDTFVGTFVRSERISGTYTYHWGLVQEGGFRKGRLFGVATISVPSEKADYFENIPPESKSEENGRVNVRGLFFDDVPVKACRSDTECQELDRTEIAAFSSFCEGVGEALVDFRATQTSIPLLGPAPLYRMAAPVLKGDGITLDIFMYMNRSKQEELALATYSITRSKQLVLERRLPTLGGAAFSKGMGDDPMGILPAWQKLCRGE
jgi:hypothetical protein